MTIMLLYLQSESIFHTQLRVGDAWIDSCKFDDTSSIAVRKYSRPTRSRFGVFVVAFWVLLKSVNDGGSRHI